MKVKAAPRPRAVKERTDPLDLHLHLAIGEVSGSAHLAMIVCYDRAPRKHSERIRAIRQYFRRMKAAIDWADGLMASTGAVEE